MQLQWMDSLHTLIMTSVQDAANVLKDLPDKLKQTAVLRLENPELTLAELAESFSPPVTKSCLNHRLRKLTSMAKTIKENTKVEEN